jgi:hypothetical protein
MDQSGRDHAGDRRTDHDRDFVMQRWARAIQAPYRSLRAANALEAGKN